MPLSLPEGKQSHTTSLTGKCLHVYEPLYQKCWVDLIQSLHNSSQLHDAKGPSLWNVKFS